MHPKNTPAAKTVVSHPPSLSRRWKWAISVLVVLQLLAVVSEPFSFFTRDGANTAPIAQKLRDSPLGRYAEFTYMNHGYFFFAPNPGPSYLMECRLIKEGQVTGRFRLPDRKLLWPRLLYHRHFMLSDFLNKLHVPPISEADRQSPDRAFLDAWQDDRNRYELVRDSMVHHLLVRYKTPAAEILRVEHRLPSSAEVFNAKMPLSDERLYAILPDTPITDALPPAVAPPQVPSPVETVPKVEP